LFIQLIHFKIMICEIQLSLNRLIYQPKVPLNCYLNDLLLTSVPSKFFAYSADIFMMYGSNLRFTINYIKILMKYLYLIIIFLINFFKNI
jgi:hypothetical protein